jgi:hypothetical protein
VRASLGEQGAQRVGKDYEVEPVAVTSGVFHPKVAMTEFGVLWYESKPSVAHAVPSTLIACVDSLARAVEGEQESVVDTCNNGERFEISLQTTLRSRWFLPWIFLQRRYY